jgi:hypothetical protein
MTLEDGNALLNLFAASGLDASKAQTALNSAVKNLPEGVSLKQFLRNLAAIEDPQKRANRAIEVFGARAGVGIANAVSKSKDPLNHHKQRMRDVRDRTREAAQAVKDGFDAQATRLLKNFGGALADIGTLWARCSVLRCVARCSSGHCSSRPRCRSSGLRRGASAARSGSPSTAWA